MRAEKISIAKEYARNAKESGFFIIADYQGLSVAKLTDLRRRMKEAGAKVQVVQNRLLARVLKEQALEGFAQAIKGPAAMIFGQGDPVRAAKILKDFIKEHAKPAIRAGALEGRYLTPAEVEMLASLPSREQLYGQLVGTLAAPMSRLVGALSQKASSLVIVLQAYQDKKAQASQG